MILKKSFAKSPVIGSLTTALRRSGALFILFLLTCGAGCASSGTLQPHQAFRQAVTPHQGYYQGQLPSYGAVSGSQTRAADGYAGYGGYNNSLPSYGQPDAATGNYGAGSYGAYGNQFASPYGNLNGGQVPTQGGYQQYYPNTGYNYQPAYTGGFTSGSC